MTLRLDPPAMSPAERKAEVAALLGAAYLRLLASRNGLESTPQGEPSCARVDRRERHGASGAAPTREEDHR